MRILIAEDDLVSRSFLSSFFEKYGDCDIVFDGIEAMDAYFMALKDSAPYGIICLDIMMPKADGIKTLKAIRSAEYQYDIKNPAIIIMTTALADSNLIKSAFDYGCDAYATKPIDSKNLTQVLGKLGLMGKLTESDEEATEDDINHEITTKCGMQNFNALPKIGNKDEGYFKSVDTLPGYKLKVMMETGTAIQFDFSSKLNTARFGRLKDEEMFRSARTDGNYLIFEKKGKIPVKITASEFMDMVLIKRRK